MVVHLAVTPAQAIAPFQQVEQLFREAEAALSRFRPESELSHLNRQAGGWVWVSSLLWELLSAALRLAEETEGIFDPTLLPALEAAGYRHDFQSIMAGSPTVHDSLTTRGRFREVGCDPTRQAFWLPRDIRVDLGGIAKGFIAQRAVEYLRPWGAALVDAGGDLVAGEAPPGWPGWPVAIATPQDAGQEGAELLQLWLKRGALATSGVDYRRWQTTQGTAHHIIDPRTGLPADTDLLTATLYHPSAPHAEAWATAALVLGAQQAGSALASRQLAGVLLSRKQRIYLSPAMRHYLSSSGTPQGERTHDYPQTACQ